MRGRIPCKLWMYYGMQFHLQMCEVLFLNDVVPMQRSLFS